MVGVEFLRVKLPLAGYMTFTLAVLGLLSIYLLTCLSNYFFIAKFRM